MTSKVSRRYAKAVFELVKGDKNGAVVADELEAFGRMIEGSREARIVLVFGMVPVEKRKQVVADLGAKMNLSKLTLQVLSVLTDAGRLRELEGIANGLRAMLSTQSGITLMEVKSAETLDGKMRASVEQKFEKVLKNKVEARYSVDPTLLGGLHVFAGGRTFDGSVAGILGTMQEQIAEGEM